MFCSKWCNRKRSVAELGMVVGCLLGKTRIFVCFGLLGWVGPYHIRILIKTPMMERTNVIGCTCACTHIKNCFPLQKFFTSFFVHHPSRIKNPRNQKHPQFHLVINGHGNKRLRHPILFPFRARVHKVEPIE